MHTPLTRRQMLRLAVLGGFGGALAACAAPAAQDPSLVPAAPAPAAPTVAPTVAQTSAATAAPAPTAAPAAPAPAAAAPAPTAQPTAGPSAALIAGMAQAATQLLGALDGERRARASYAFADAERVRWHWTTPSGFPRNGLPLNEMAQPQRDLALALLSAGHSPTGYQKALAIMALQRELGSDPEHYYVTIFGEPGGAAPWGWRWEGHHYSRHFTIVGDQVTMTPFFLGARPTTTNAGLQAMPREENAARELVSSLSGLARDQAIFQTTTLNQHLTQNQPLVSPLDPVGISYAQLDPAQQGLVDELITSYLSTLPDPMSQPIWGRIRAAGMGEIRFGWAGPIEPLRPAYYRLQGPTFLLEFDNSRNGGTHIHSVWRDFDQDFGRQLAV